MTTLVASEPRFVSLAAIERELARPWQHPGGRREEQTTRALMGNLIAVCRSQPERAGLEREVAQIVPHYPTRALLLVADPANQSAGIEASIALQGCIRGSSLQICGELVIIGAGGPATPRLASVARAVLLGDLPTSLWWASPEAPPLAGELFSQLAELADQVIYDSAAWADPLRQLVVTANWVSGSGRQVASDLAWRRARLWRRIIAQSLDPTLAPGALEGIEEAHIEHGPHALTQAWLLSGWLALRLGWVPRGGTLLPGPGVSWSFEWPHGRPRVEIRRHPEGEPDIRTVRIVTRVDGRPVTFRFELQAAGRVAVSAERLTGRVLSLTGPVYSRSALVARQLPDLARDRLFESSVALARTMAEAVL